LKAGLLRKPASVTGRAAADRAAVAIADEAVIVVVTAAAVATTIDGK